MISIKSILKLVFVFSLVLTIVFTYLFWVPIPDPYRNEMTIDFDGSSRIRFIIGDWFSDIISEFNEENIEYSFLVDNKHPVNGNLLSICVKQSRCRYIFVFHEYKLDRIESSDGNGLGTILPKNYYD